MQFFAEGDENLGLHEVDAGDAFGDGVLDLDAGVHLDEEPLLAVHVVEVFHGAGVVVADGLGEIGGGLAEVMTKVAGEVDGGGDFDHLLVAALHGAVALVHVDHVAVLVAEDLHFDVFGALDVALEEDGGVAEGVLGFVLGFGETGLELGGFFDDAHAATATTEGGFDDERETDFLRGGDRLVGIGDGVFGSGEDGDVGGDGLGTGGGLVAHGAEEVAVRSDEDDAFASTSFGEVGIFGKEAVTGVNHGDPFAFCESDDAFVIEVGTDGAFVGV